MTDGGNDMIPKVLAMIFASALFITFALATPVFAGWGVDTGRADETDSARLAEDFIGLSKALQHIHEYAAGEFGAERQRQLLGIESDKFSAEQLTKKIDEYWKNEVEGPMKHIVENPAASCAEAITVSQLRIASERERQILGIGGGDTAAVFTDEIVTKISQRCREEKLDECNVTGRFAQITRWAVETERQGQILGLTDDDNFTWALDAMKECANYELHYVSTTDIDFDMHSVIDGRIKLSFKPGDGTSPMGQLINGKIEGETETGSGQNPFLQKLTCSGQDGVVITCGPGGSVKHPAKAEIKFMDMRQKEYLVGDRWIPKTQMAGEDKIKLIFSPAMLGVSAIIKTPDGPTIPMPFVEVGATGFDIAHKKDRIKGDLMYTAIEDTKRGVYPMLFEFNRAGKDIDDDVNASDSTEFELIHKPKKKPFPARPSKPRVPLKPRK